MNENMVCIVLGNRLKDDGSISEIQEERLKMVLEIEETFKPKCYILSGGLANEKAGRTEAAAMYEYLIEKGFEKERLIKEEQSLSTVGNALYSIPIAKELNAKTVLVCTSAYHFADPIYKAIESFTNYLKDSDINLMTYTKPSWR